MKPKGVGRDPPPRWLEQAVVIVTVVVLCAVHGPLIGYKMFANVDEAYAGAIGERLLEGFKLYEGAVSQRGPLMYYAFEAIAWLHGWDNIVALRVWALAFCLSHLLAVCWIGRALLSREAALVATALTGYALAFGFPAYDSYALHGETLQLPAVLGATLLVARAVRRRPGSGQRRWRLAGSGLLFAAAASIKQSAILHPAAAVAWLAIDGHRRKAAARTVALDSTVVIGSALIIPSLLLVHAARQGTLGALVYYCVTYNREVHLHPQPSHAFPWLPPLFSRLVEQTSFFLLLTALVALALAPLLARARSALKRRDVWALGRGFGVRRFIALNLVIAIVSASMMDRFFPHYFLVAWPFAALTAGATVDRSVRSRRCRTSVRRLTVGFLAFLLCCGWLSTVFGEKIDGRVMHDRTVNDVSKVIAATTSPDDRIFVWGFSPWLYQYSHRRPAGRYVFETYVTGVVPWFWEKPGVERARVVPGSVDALLGDLERERPVVVVDAGSIMLARPMRAYAAFAAWLHEHYCFSLRLGAFDLYRRKQDDDACAWPWFPRPFNAVDWSGRAIPVLEPAVADEALTRPLPRGSFFKPIWFRDEATPAGLGALHDSRREKEEAEAVRDGLWIERTEFE